MDHIELERSLRARVKKRRAAGAILCVFFLAVVILFWVLYEESRTVDEIGWGAFKYQNVTYNRNLIFGILFGLLGFIPCASFLLVDYICGRMATFEVNGDHITLYRGLLHNNLYLNGECKDSATNRYYLETTLSDGSKVTVALGKWSAHLSFSGGHPAIDV